ncbi:MAG: glycosyltransferase, exosortase A system-associated [Gammaproteobacteria bacterium]|nr:glycosyltransferase, exosortase A system-associated [Gammaproteobacteria bacterium]NNL51635.1 glycosyltransferase, exosortase A system-associated [Woeseiaceae bacterium]
MHILHILDHSIPLHSGYAFRSRAILKAQRSLGWRTSHLTSSKQYPPGAMEEDIDGLHFYRTLPRWPLLDRVPVANQIAVVEYLARRLAEVCEREQPDILHAHSPCLVGLAALRVGHRNGLPVVYEMRASWEDAAAHHGTTREGSLRYRISRRLETHVLRRADAVTTICEGLREDILTRGVDAKDVGVIPNAVDVQQFTEREPDASLARQLGVNGSRVLGFVGSFYAYEGLALLLKALPRIRMMHADVRLLLVGGGPEEARLKALCSELGLDNAVVFTGRIPHEQVGAYYNLVDIFVYPRVPSRLTEMVTPLKPLEAMAQRRLVVASDVGGHRELIRDGETGRLFAADNLDSLVEVTLKLLDNPGNWSAMHDAGRRFVEQERTWAASVARYGPVYQRVLARA